MVKNECTFNYKMEQVLKSFVDLETEKQWHKGADLTEILETGAEEDCATETRHVHSKFPWPFTDRDWLFRRKIFKSYLGDPTQSLVLTQSCKHQKYPEKKDPVRAEIFLQGHLFKDLGNGTTKLTMVSQADVKITGMIGMAEKKMPEGQYKFFEEWIKGLEKIYGKK